MKSGILIWWILFSTVCWSQKISPSVRFYPGSINCVSIEKNGSRLVIYGDSKNELKEAELLLFTHFRRDVTWAGRNLINKGALAMAPEKEKSYFNRGDSIWQDFSKSHFHDYKNQSTKIDAIPFKIDRFLNGGEILKWQDIEIKVLETPGYTRGSVSYITDIDHKRYAFVGDLIYGDGKIFDLYSFQDSLGNIGGYHGYAARLSRLISSLKLISDQRPDYLVPSRGPVITDPDNAIPKLISRIRLLYKNYLAINASRWYHPDWIKELTDRICGLSIPVELMSPAVTEKNPPSWYMHTVNSNLIVSKDSTAFLIDCGLKGAYDQIQKLRITGRLKKLEGIFITHYHDDHTNFINDLVNQSGCPVYITRELKEILQNPSGYHLPCLTDIPIKNLTVMKEGQQLKWKEFILTFRYFPGQTLYHDALLAEKVNGESVFFIGDSFTPAGIDDYCLLNRNFLHPGMGYFYCLDMLKKQYPKTLLANQHVDSLFTFSPKQLEYMTANLNERITLLKDLLPWDNPNYGLDEKWISIYPYTRRAEPGQKLEYSVKIFNHSECSKVFYLKTNVPAGFSARPDNAKIYIKPRTEGSIVFRIKTPDKVSSPVSLFTVNVKDENHELHQWGEALIETTP